MAVFTDVAMSHVTMSDVNVWDTIGICLLDAVTGALVSEVQYTLSTLACFRLSRYIGHLQAPRCLVVVLIFFFFDDAAMHISEVEKVKHNMP